MRFREQKQSGPGQWEMGDDGVQRWVTESKTVHQYSLDGVSWYTIGEAMPGLSQGLPLPSGNTPKGESNWIDEMCDALESEGETFDHGGGI